MSRTLTDEQVAAIRAKLAEIEALLDPPAAPAEPAVAKPAPALVPGALIVPGLPPAYAWLTTLGDGLPLTIAEGLKEFGTRELAGAANSARIMAWAKEVELEAIYTSDAVPWCGLFAAVVAKRANKPFPAGPLWALNWAKFGEEVASPGLGDVLVYKRQGGGHVHFYVGEDATHYHGLGGNQSDAVNIMRIEKARCVAKRRPIYRNKPAGVKPYRLAAAGAVSTNEA